MQTFCNGSDRSEHNTNEKMKKMPPLEEQLANDHTSS